MAGAGGGSLSAGLSGLEISPPARLWQRGGTDRTGNVPGQSPLPASRRPNPGQGNAA